MFPILKVLWPLTFLRSRPRSNSKGALIIKQSLILCHVLMLSICLLFIIVCQRSSLSECFSWTRCFSTDSRFRKSEKRKGQEALYWPQHQHCLHPTANLSPHSQHLNKKVQVIAIKALYSNASLFWMILSNHS